MRPVASSATPVLLTMALLLLCATVAGCGGVGSEEAACAAIKPRIEAAPAHAAPSEVFRLRGKGFARYPSRGGPLGGECPRPLPERDIRVELVQGDRTWNLGSAYSGEDLAFTAVLKVPAGAEPGRAVVRATNRNYGPTETSFQVLGSES